MKRTPPWPYHADTRRSAGVYSSTSPKIDDLMSERRPNSPIASTLGVIAAVTSPPKLDAVWVPPMKDESENVSPPNPWTEKLALCARADAGAAHTSNAAAISRLRIFEDTSRWRSTEEQLQCQFAEDTDPQG